MAARSSPIDAGQSKDIKLKVRPPSTIDAGHFPVRVTVNAEDASAKVDLALDVVGQPQLQVSGRDGLLSARAVAAQQISIPIVVTALAENVKLSASAPTGWKVTLSMPSTSTSSRARCSACSGLTGPARRRRSL